jgi:hypothetical protein
VTVRDTAPLPNGTLAVVKRDCPTCILVAPLLRDLVGRGALAAVYSQDDPAFPDAADWVHDDRELGVSYRLGIDTVPTLVRLARDGTEIERTEGWMRSAWEAFTGVAGLGPDLPEHRPGCGSLSVDPDRATALAVRWGGEVLASRRVDLASLEDEHEALFDRGWTDGLPVVPPTPERVLRMLAGTTRAPDEIVAVVPPDLVPCSVEKVAINAVMAGCRPEYLPVVLAAVEAACTDEFNIHGVLATTMSVGPVIVVNGPIARAIGMNSGVNVLGQGNRANATIGRALQLVVRNVGGGRPGGIDRATLGNPGKVGFCFAERVEDNPWTTLAEERGFDRDTSAVTVFAGEGPRVIADQQSRTPESLTRSLAAALRATVSVKMASGMDAMLVLSPEHLARYRDAGWDKARLRRELDELLLLDGAELVAGAGGITDGLPAAVASMRIPKFKPDGGLLVVHAGGGAGLFSAVIGGWANGAMGSQPVTREVRP